MSPSLTTSLSPSSELVRHVGNTGYRSLSKLTSGRRKEPILLLLHRRSKWTTVIVFSMWQSFTHYGSRWDSSLPFTPLPTPASFVQESTLAQLFPIFCPAVPAALYHCSIIFSPLLSGLLSLSSYKLTSTTEEEKLCISCALVRPLQSRAA